MIMVISFIILLLRHADNVQKSNDVHPEIISQSFILIYVLLVIYIRLVTENKPTSHALPVSGRLLLTLVDAW